MKNQLINYKIVTIGESGVGKTSINMSFTMNKFEKNMIPTIGSNFFTKNVSAFDKSVKIGIWDTAGQEKYRSIVPMFFKNTQGVMLVFDITDRRSFEKIQFWFDLAVSYSKIKPQMALIGNKSDLQAKRNVFPDEIEKFCDDHDIAYFETSCTSGENIEEAFIHLTHQIIKNNTYEQTQSNAIEIIPEKPKKKCC